MAKKTKAQLTQEVTAYIASAPSVQEARVRLLHYLKHGFEIRCPLCQRRNKYDHRAIDWTNIKILSLLSWYFKQNPQEQWVHVEKYFRRLTQEHGISKPQGTQGNRFMVAWGLLEERAGKSPDGRPYTGEYRVSPFGTAFLSGTVQVRQYLHTYSGQAWLDLNSDLVYVHEVVGGFNYLEFINDSTPPSENVWGR